MPDGELPTPAAAASADLMSEADSMALAEEQIRAEVNAPNTVLAPLTAEQQVLLTEVQQRLLTGMAPYIGERLNDEMVAQMQRGVDYQLESRQILAERAAIEREMSRHVTNEIDREFINRLSDNSVEITPARIDDLIEDDFHTSYSGARFPAIDRLAGSSTIRTRAGVVAEATVHIYYNSYDQLRSHLDLRIDGSINRGMVWYQGEYWIVNSILTATAVNVGDYEATLELTRVTTPSNNPAPELTLIEEPNGQTAWTLADPPPANTISLDFTINGEGAIITNPNGWAGIAGVENSNEPSTVLKKAKCPICQKRGCVSSHHIPTAAELEQSLNSAADMLNAEALNEAQSVTVRAAFETAINQIDLSQQLNAVARMADTQAAFIPLRTPEPPILGTVVEQHGDTSYIRLGNNTTIAHDLRIDGVPVAPGTRVTWDPEGHLTPVLSPSTPIP